MFRVIVADCNGKYMSVTSPTGFIDAAIVVSQLTKRLPSCQVQIAPHTRALAAVVAAQVKGYQQIAIELPPFSQETPPTTETDCHGK